jgi:hypothetical protein
MGKTDGAIIPVLVLLTFFTGSCRSTVLTGRVVIKGNEPHSYPVLVTPERGEFVLSGDLSGELRERYQGTTITVEGRIAAPAAGPGRPPRFEVTRVLDGP